MSWRRIPSGASDWRSSPKRGTPWRCARRPTTPASKRIAADPRVEFTNPTYAQPYCYNISGESIIRQFAYGIRKIRSHFPDVEFVTYSVEEPCFTSSLPQILRLFGFKYASLKCPNTCWGGYTAPYGGELVNWTAPDGTLILTSPRYACEELQPNSVWQTTAWGNETPYIEACIRQDIAHPVGMCYQDAGWRYGPWIGSGDSIRNNSIYVTWREYFERISEGRTTDDYRFPQEDIHVSLMWGSQVMQRIAREVRRAENSLSTAEKMGAIANLSNGYLYKQGDMDEAWRTLMLAQHHDSWIVPYNGLHGKGTWADHIHRWTAATDSICAGIVAAAEGSLAAAGNGRKEFGIRVCNTLGTPRREVVRAALPEGFGAEGAVVRDIRGKKVGSVLTTSDGTKSLLFEAEVPAFGYTTYTVREGRPQKGAQTAPHAATEGRIVVENDMYRLEIDPARGGIVTSLVAKHLGGREYADAGSDYALGELRGHFYEEGRFRSSTETPAEVSVLCDNDLEKRIRIRGAIASHPFTETITLRKGDRKIDFDLRIDWKHNVGIGEFAQKDAFNKNRRAFYDSRYKLNIYFPVALDAPELYKDAPFDVCKSRLKDTRFSTWDNIKHDILLHWADLAERDGGYGLALLTDHTTSYIYGGGSPLATDGAVLRRRAVGLTTTRSTVRRTSASPWRPTTERGTRRASTRRASAGTSRCSATPGTRPPEAPRSSTSPGAVTSCRPPIPRREASSCACSTPRATKRRRPCGSASPCRRSRRSTSTAARRAVATPPCGTARPKSGSPCPASA